MAIARLERPGAPPGPQTVTTVPRGLRGSRARVSGARGAEVAGGIGDIGAGEEGAGAEGAGADGVSTGRTPAIGVSRSQLAASTVSMIPSADACRFSTADAATTAIGTPRRS